MDNYRVGVLHPGAMGVSVAASARNSGHSVYWASDERSDDTRQRAEKAGLLDGGTLANVCATCDVIVSICPPHAAEDVAAAVMAHGFDGVYLDANAISPGRAKRIAALVNEGGASFVDGSIIGGPAWEPGKTWLYLSGPEAQTVADCFASGPLETCIIGEAVDKASALKMCFAAYSKGTTALLCAILGAAESLNVRDELAMQWSRGGSDFADEANRRATQVTAKAWRFAGEMDEISATFEEAGMPSGFHAAAAEIYRRLADFKDAPDTPELDAVLAALLANTEKI